VVTERGAVCHPAPLPTSLVSTTTRSDKTTDFDKYAKDRLPYYDAVEDALPRGVSVRTLDELVTAIYDERATDMRLWEILSGDDAVEDAVSTTTHIMSFFVMGDDGWDLKSTITAPPSQQVVMLARAGPEAQGPEVRGPRAHRQVELQAPGPAVQGQQGRLGIDLGGRQRLPKPRSLQEIDEIEWAYAQQLSIVEIAVQYGITKDTELDFSNKCKVENMTDDIEHYYSNMCKVGQQALACVIHTKTQAIYDARCAQKIRRAKRKK